MFRSLSAKEHQLAKYVSKGLTNQEIAVHMHLAEQTIKNMLRGVFIKSGMRNRTELALTYSKSQSRRNSRTRKAS